ncbi:hypothetical protein ANN_12535 [Periplaneta americana]|uniref:Uncharacterized protein n=1 Tax=Periplaneta americana TaxID=6978 RepID=A0ABQ8TJ39_PERAM|nr:hypothetical protein ANN_12535 [Periplaneta americana]
MPKNISAQSTLIRQWLTEYSEFTYDGKIIFCKICSKQNDSLKLTTLLLTRAFLARVLEYNAQSASSVDCVAENGTTSYTRHISNCQSQLSVLLPRLRPYASVPVVCPVSELLLPLQLRTVPPPKYTSHQQSANHNCCRDEVSSQSKGMYKKGFDKKWGYIRKELNIYNINEKVEDYKEKWKEHLSRMDNERFPTLIQQYQPKGKKDVGRPRKSNSSSNSDDDGGGGGGGGSGGGGGGGGSTIRICNLRKVKSQTLKVPMLKRSLRNASS